MIESKVIYNFILLHQYLEVWIKIIQSEIHNLVSSVADPDPHVFGPPESGSGYTIVRGTNPDPDPALNPDPDPFIIMQK